MVSPWWTCPLLAVSAYAVLAYVCPVLLTAQPTLQKLGNVPRLFAPWVAFLILFAGVVAWMRRIGGMQLLNAQRDAESIRKLTWSEFEELVAASYRRQGYRVIENGGGGADGGVDLIVLRDGEKVLVQCKHWRASRVGVKIVRELHGITCSKEHVGSKGCLVTFGWFTSDAREFARDNNVELIDRDSLVAMIESVKRSDLPAGATEQSQAICPRCGSAMVVRTARRGPEAGSCFLGCSRYPDCRGTQSIKH
jgi:restriction system protein